MDSTPTPLAREKVNEFTGTGCLLQALGLLAPIALGAAWGGPGALVGLVLLVVLWSTGTRLATRWRCGHCRNPLATADVRVCPACGSPLD